MSIQAPERPPDLATPPEPVAEPAVAAPVAGTLRTSIAAFLSASAAGWMAAGLFRGATPRIIAIGGALIGAGLVALSYRTRRPSLVQYLVVPVAGVAGALLVLPDARGGADLVSLVSEALRGGGLAQPPLPFDPGWKFVLIVLTAVLGAASAAIGVALSRPKLAVLMPAPVIVGGALLAPPGGEITTSAVAIGLVLVALAVSYGSELHGDAGSTAGGFERKRLIRGAAAVVVLSAAMVALGHARFLFPSTTKERVVPAARPSSNQVLPDRPLFAVRSKDPGPWRLGVLDGYDGRAWLLPSYDPARLRDVRSDGSLVETLVKLNTDRPTVDTEFSIARIEGHVLPVAAGAVRVRGLGARAQIDPVTQALRLPEARLRPGLTYTVTSVVPPDGRALAAAPVPPEWARVFTNAPDPPNEVVVLLAKAPLNLWDRLQFMRAALYRNVIAAGAGHPSEVPPERVAAMLRGGAEATPYEITAAEALIARWAGVPARIGYGFYAGERASASSAIATVRPRHGATWLEAYFDGYGWVPVVGVPPRARSSLSQDQKNQNRNVRPSDELALFVHIPIRLQSARPLYVAVRYWFGVGVMILAILLLVWWAFPGMLKIARRIRRGRWARARGPQARIAVAFADLRDSAADAGAGNIAATPLRFCAGVADDEEHEELAWLVTRALWGDLRRDARDDDATAAEEMARSVRQRLRRALSPPARIVAFGARTSLRDPYATEVPNVWPSWLRHRTLRSAARASLSRRKRLRAARRALHASLLALVLSLTSCGSGATPASQRAHHLPTRLVPDKIGDITFRREPVAEKAYASTGAASLVTDGHVYTVHLGTTIEASIQMAAFKPGIDIIDDDDVRDGVLGSIGGGRFDLTRLGEDRVYVRDLPEQRLLLWFTPDGGAMVLMDARRAFSGADSTFGSVLRYIRGADAASAGPPPLPYDSRRGAQP